MPLMRRGAGRGLPGCQTERIGNYHSSAPATKVVSASNVDEHNGIEHWPGESSLSAATSSWKASTSRSAMAPGDCGAL